MPKIRALSPDEARSTLANRFGSKADRMRQLATKFGVRPNRCFLRWTRWTGSERGEGDELDVLTYEILPTPRVQSLDNLSFSIQHAGVIPVGSLRVDRISTALFTRDVLMGKAWPNASQVPGLVVSTLPPMVTPMPGMDPREPHIPEPWEFFWEVVEDGRGDSPPKRMKFRLMNEPFRRPGKVDWTVMLERVGQDRTRDNRSGIGTGLE